jgi:hypothetical protein
MSRDLKYIGMDVHQEAVVIAVLNGSGKLIKEGSKSDKVDARKLAELLRTGMLRPVYHGENGLRLRCA